jgi:hypothetical protein
MWILIILIVITLIVIYFILRIRSNNKLYNNIIVHLTHFYLNFENTQSDKEKADEIALSIYKLAFYKMGKTPHDFTHLELESKKLIRNVYYSSLFEATKNSIIEVADLYGKKIHVNYTLSKQHLDFMLNKIMEQIKVIK